MNSRRARLWTQRQALVLQSAALRERLDDHARALAPLAALADRTWAAGQWARAHPWVPTLLALLYLWRRPRQVFRWGRRAWGAWRWVQRMLAAWTEGPGHGKFR